MFLSLIQKETIIQFNRLTKNKERSIFYGISEFVNGRKKPEDWAKLIQNIPDNRILAESDLADPVLAGKGLERAYTMISSAKGWSEKETRRKIRENVDGFLLLK